MPDYEPDVHNAKVQAAWYASGARGLPRVDCRARLRQAVDRSPKREGTSSPKSPPVSSRQELLHALAAVYSVDGCMPHAGLGGRLTLARRPPLQGCRYRQPQTHWWRWWRGCRWRRWGVGGARGKLRLSSDSAAGIFARRVIADVHVVQKVCHIHSRHGFSVLALEAIQRSMAGDVCIAVASSNRAGPAATAGLVAVPVCQRQREAWHMRPRRRRVLEYVTDCHHGGQKEEDHKGE